jgi:hypothetical protein
MENPPSHKLGCVHAIHPQKVVDIPLCIFSEGCISAFGVCLGGPPILVTVLLVHVPLCECRRKVYCTLLFVPELIFFQEVDNMCGVALSVALTFVMKEGEDSFANRIGYTCIFVESVAVHAGARLEHSDEQAFQSF